MKRGASPIAAGGGGRHAVRCRAAQLWRETRSALVLGLTWVAIISMFCMAEPDGRDGVALAAMFEAARTGDVGTLQKSIAAGIPIDAPEPGSGLTSLGWAARAHHGEAVAWLLANGADLAACAPGYGTPLTAAADTPESSAMVRLLLARGADPDASGWNRHTPLMCAIEWGDVESARALIRGGARVNARDRHGHTPLALAQGNEPMTHLLIAAGAR